MNRQNKKAYIGNIDLYLTVIMKIKEKKSYGIFFYLVFVGKYLPTLFNSFRKIKTLVYLVKNRRSIVLVIPSLIETFGTS